MKAKLLKNIRLQYEVRYLKGKVLLINHEANELEEFDSVKEAASYLIYRFCGMEVHQDYIKKERFRKNLKKYYKNQTYGNSNSKRTKRNVPN